MKILLDTNFLIDVIRFKINLEEIYNLVGSHELVTLSSVKNELVRISKQKSKSGMHAKVALKLVESIRILNSDLLPDKFMLKTDKETIIATNDIELRKRLKALGRKTIYLKSKKHLAIG